MPTVRSVVLFLSFMLFPALCNLALADKERGKISVAYGVVQGFTNEDGTGPGADILDEMVKRLEQRGYQVETWKLPFRRLISGFQVGRYDLGFPIVSDPVDVKGAYIKWGFKKIPLYSAPVYNGGKFVIYTARGKARLNNISDLKGRVVGVFAGAYIPSELKPPTEYKVLELKANDKAFEMVRLGRIDAFLVQQNWGDVILQENPVEGIQHGAPFGDVFGSFIAQPTENGASLLAEINQLYGAMIVDGTYDRILNSNPRNFSIVRPGE